MELEELLQLYCVEDQIGRTDLEHLPSHAPTAAGKPHLPATGDDQLYLLRQEIEKQAERVLAVE